jgi:hypothetical protein
MAAQPVRTLACVMDAIPKEERTSHLALGQHLLVDLAQARNRLANGYAIRLPADTITEVARFVAKERKCCPFLEFEISMPADSDSLWLRMTGPEGSREILDAELNLADCGAGSCSCG